MIAVGHSKGLDSVATLPIQLVEEVLACLGLSQREEPTLDFLQQLYRAWCQRVPFDNILKMIHVHSGNPAPLPGSTAEDFLQSWLKLKTGGTCWSSANAFYTLLVSLGFEASLGVGTMLAAPDLPPNHGTVIVTLEGAVYLV